MRSYALALSLSVCFTSLGGARAATPSESWAWACAARDSGAIVCEGSFGLTIPLPALHDESGSLMSDAIRGTETIVHAIAAGTETGFRGTETGFRGTETGFRGTETGFVSLREIAAGAESGFRYALIVEWTCQVQMSLDGRSRPTQASCDDARSRLVARRR